MYSFNDSIDSGLRDGIARAIKNKYRDYLYIKNNWTVKDEFKYKLEVENDDGESEFKSVCGLVFNYVMVVDGVKYCLVLAHSYETIKQLNEYKEEFDPENFESYIDDGYLDAFEYEWVYGKNKQTINVNTNIA